MRDAGLRKLFQKHLPKFHWQSVETGSTGAGVPDLNYCYAGVEGWLELKRASGLRCYLAPEQIAWLERRSRAGGKTFIVVRRITKPIGFWLFRGMDARRVDAHRLTEIKALVSSTENPASWPWPDIQRALTA